MQAINQSPNDISKLNAFKNLSLPPTKFGFIILLIGPSNFGVREDPNKRGGKMLSEPLQKK